MKKEINWLRKFESLFILIFALFYFYTNKELFLVISVILFLIFILFDFIYYCSNGKNIIAEAFFKIYPHKKLEKKRIITDPSIFFASTIIMTYIFSKEIVVLSLILMTFVDAFEQIFGIKFKTAYLFWNKDKNWGGTFAGFFAGLIFGFLTIYFLNLPFRYIFLLPVSLAAAFGGTSPKFDNILIPWLSAMVLMVV
jgi:dolichol kinase